MELWLRFTRLPAATAAAVGAAFVAAGTGSAATLSPPVQQLATRGVESCLASAPCTAYLRQALTACLADAQCGTALHRLLDTVPGLGQTLEQRFSLEIDGVAIGG